MAGQKKDFYHNFSRKDLQDLCKKYGLPANKSNCDMGSSLILYLKKKKLTSRIWKATGSDSLSVETLEPRRRRISTSADQQKDSRGTMSSGSSGNNQCNIQNGPPDLHKSKDPATSDKASEDVGVLSQFHRDSNSCADLLENIFPHDVTSSVEAPNFLFDVSSEDGIQLLVDLNSSPSDWIKSFKDGVHICSDMRISSLVDSYKEVVNGDVAEASHLVTASVSALPESNQLNGAERSLSSPSRNTGNTTHRLENFGKEQATTPSRPEFDTEKQVRGEKFCIRGLLSSPSQEIRESSNNTFDQGRVRVCRDISSQPKSNGTEQCGLINSVTFTEMQTFEIAGHTKSASSPGLLDGHSSDQTEVNQDKVEIENNKASTSSEHDEQILESQNHPADNQMNGPSLSPLRDYGPDFGDLVEGVQKNKSTSMEVLGRVVAGDQKKKSECLDFRDSMTDTWRKSGGSESSRDRKRKLLVNGTGGHNQFVKPDAKITRITRQFAGKIHDSRRRSSRLFAK